MKFKKIYLFGSNGFIAKGFQTYFKEKKIEFLNINKKNYKKYKNSYCDLFLNLNGNSSKILAEKNLLKSYENNVSSSIKTINDFKVGKYVYISSCAVYNNVNIKNKTKEDSKIDLNILDNYGFIKYICEQIIKRKVKNYLIIRPSGLVGIGLKKNVVYDILNRKKLFDNKNSLFNFINTKNFAEIVFKLAKKKNNEIYNVASNKNIKVSKINDLFFKKKVNYSKYNLIKNEISVSKLSRIIKLESSQKYISMYMDQIKNIQKK